MKYLTRNLCYQRNVLTEIVWYEGIYTLFGKGIYKAIADFARSG